MAIYDFFLSRNNGPTLANYVGHKGRLFYDEDEKVLRYSDGETVGGFPINPITTTVSTTEPTNVPQGAFWLNPATLALSCYHNGEFIPTIDTATADKIGGVKLGPGVITNSEGQIIIDSTDLDFAFGDFSAITGTYPEGHPKEGDDYAILKTINDDEDAVLASNGTGAIKVVGEFRIYSTNGNINGSMLQTPVFSVSADGDISATSLDIQETNDLGLQAALNVTINEAGLTKTPAVVSGSVAQFTGRDDRTSLLVLDTYGTDTTTTLTGGEFVFRTGRGTNASTTAVQSGDRLGQVVAAGWASNGYGGLGVGGLRILANENYTPTARGSKLELFVTPNGTLTPTTIATVDSTGITLASGTVLTGNVTGDVSGTAGSVTNGVYTTDTGSVTNTMLAGSIANDKLANSTISGIALGANLATLTFGTHLTGTSYNGSTGVTIATDATNANTVSTIVARDSNGDFAARHISAKIKHATRNAGSVNSGLTIDYNTDDWIVGTFTEDVTITHSNLSAGMEATVVLYNASGVGDDDLTFGVGTENNTYQTSFINVNDTNLIILKFYSFGTTTDDLYCEVNYRDLEN